MEIKEKFKYVMAGSPIDYWEGTISKESLINSLKRDPNQQSKTEFIEYSNETTRTINVNYQFIKTIVKKFSGEEPIIIKYFLIPNYDRYEMEVCALAKIRNNGTTYMLTNNEKYANFVSKDDCYEDFRIEVFAD